MARGGFKRGSVGQRARSGVAERGQAGGRKVRNPFAVATAAVKRMSVKKRRQVARRQ